MPLNTTLDARNPSIRLTGAIDMPAAYALLDELKLLCDYYQFRTVELQIDSPGGDVSALHHLLQSLEPWRKGEGRVLRTVGLNEICSAAAILLSFGTMGHRCASSHSRLLYHPVRTSFREDQYQTLAQLRATGKQLGQWDRFVLEGLVEHIAGSIDVGPRAAYLRKLKRLFQQERFITAEQAVELRLIDRVVGWELGR
jgi:ATP-dependent protease ClpP protease subunit